MTTWFTSDTHFGHANIIKYTNRPFKNVEEMDETLIDNWNNVVKPYDTVYHLGDFTLGGYDQFIKYQKKLNGILYIVPGSHDKRWLRGEGFRNFVAILPPLYTLELRSEILVLCHYAMRVWDRSHYGSWHLYGHSHGTLPALGRSLDVGVDCHGFYPISLEEVKIKMSEVLTND